MSTRKRKANPKYEDEDDKPPRKCAKSTRKPPAQRKPAPPKREVNRKHAVEEDDLTYKRGSIKSMTPTKRMPAPRTVKAKRGDPDWLVTNEKSSLAHEDLHAELSDPRTYDGFTREDWEDIRSTLPENVPLNADGYSISWDFLKYDADFRRGIREFQEDLSTGRLDPAWQAAAAEAMEERARGDYDAYKENNYEEFWGQKQKLAYDVLAGESTKLKLETMVENGVFRVGDEFVFIRVIGRGENRVLIEKELKITAVGDGTLTFAIPPGQLKFCPPVPAPRRSAHEKSDGSEPLIDDARRMTASTDTGMDEGHITVDYHTDNDAIRNSAHEHRVLDDGGLLAQGVQSSNGNINTRTEGNEAAGKDETDGDGSKYGAQEPDTSGEGVPLADEVQSADAGAITSVETDEVPLNGKSHDSGPESDTQETIVTNADFKTGGLNALPNGHTNNKTSSRPTEGTADDPRTPDSEAPESSEGAISYEITSLKQLMDKAIEIDGRLDPKNRKAVCAASPWKFMRVKRNNQDLGTLFEMREEFYAYKLPKITKRTKK